MLQSSLYVSACISLYSDNINKWYLHRYVHPFRYTEMYVFVCPNVYILCNTWVEFFFFLRGYKTSVCRSCMLNKIFSNEIAYRQIVAFEQENHIKWLDDLIKVNMPLNRTVYSSPTDNSTYNETTKSGIHWNYKGWYAFKPFNNQSINHEDIQHRKIWYLRWFALGCGTIKQIAVDDKKVHIFSEK